MSTSNQRLEAWIGWSAVKTGLALVLGDAKEALETSEIATRSIRELGGIVCQVPHWIQRWELLNALGCEDLGNQLQTQIDGWVNDYPEYRFSWRRARGKLTEEEWLQLGHEEFCAERYLMKARVAVRAGGWNEALFHLEEARYRSRRARASCLTPVILARLAVVRPRVFDDTKDPEPILARCWAKLVKLGCFVGRVELLAVWSVYRHSIGDETNGHKLFRAALRQLQRLRAGITAQHDPRALVVSQGAEPEFLHDDNLPLFEELLEKNSDLPALASSER